ncbi:MAG: thiamine diphosphokinase [Clostridia bacterium]|nr:thiamine diphosphokinase [Clostridia bacterium]
MGEKKLKTVYIYTGGETYADLLTAPPSGAYAIAADSGYDLAVRCGVLPQLLVGDMDSIEAREIPDSVETVKVKAEKDETDTMLAVDLALSMGAEKIFIFGGLGGRADHGLSNMYLLEYIHGRGADGCISDGRNIVRYLRDGSITVPCSGYKYFSLISLDATAEGVTVTGGKYPLENAVLKRERQYAVSNEFLQETGAATVSVKKGALLVITSRF